MAATENNKITHLVGLFLLIFGIEIFKFYLNFYTNFLFKFKNKINKMAKASYLLSSALRKAAENLKNGKPYQWGHMGSCNCGHLAQVLLNMPKGQIHAYAMEKTGDWNEQLNDYCPTSHIKMDQLIWSLLEKGLNETDLMDLEYLKNDAVLNKISKDFTPLLNNKREHVILYLETWADIMEEELVKAINVGESILENV
jgi:hypothetical protein